eukprot:scaffold98325_cov60-Phaeocystis_antarctica.AAC.1
MRLASVQTSRLASQRLFVPSERGKVATLWSGDVRVGRTAARIRRAEEEGVGLVVSHHAGAACRAFRVGEHLATRAVRELNAADAPLPFPPLESEPSLGTGLKYTSRAPSAPTSTPTAGSTAGADSARTITFHEACWKSGGGAGDGSEGDGGGGSEGEGGEGGGGGLHQQIGAMSLHAPVEEKSVLNPTL